MSMSTGPAAAIVAASGFIWSMNGQMVVATATAASDPVVRKRKSRFVTEASPWPSEAVSELIVMQRVSKIKPSGLGIVKPLAPNEAYGASPCVSAPCTLRNHPMRLGR